MKAKKKYFSPKIIGVELECSQAILHVCKAGGIYMWRRWGANRCVTVTQTNTVYPGYCGESPKGAFKSTWDDLYTGVSDVSPS